MKILEEILNERIKVITLGKKPTYLLLSVDKYEELLSKLNEELTKRKQIKTLTTFSNLKVLITEQENNFVRVIY